MAQAKAERLLQLLLILRSSRPTRERLAEIIPDYREAPSDAALERKFERDKQDLRDIGLPVTTVALDVLDENAIGYTIDLTGHTLPDLHLSADETAAVALAGQVWANTTAAAAARTAVLKVSADADLSDDVADLPALTAGAEHVPALLEALRQRQAVRFDYRSATGPTSAPTTRTVQPWAVVPRRRAWYLVGWDVDRDDRRAFRLNRLLSPPVPFGAADGYTIPDAVDADAAVEPLRGEGGTARLRVAGASTWPLRRRAGATAGEDDDRSGDRITVPYGALDAFADELAGYGSAVTVLAPPELRDAVIARLRSLAGGDPA